MKYFKIAVLSAAVGLSALTTGCASISNGGTSEAVSVKTQKGPVEVAGADCVLTNSKGTWKVTTPGTVSVHRASGDMSVKCQKEGEADALATVQSSARKGAIAGNLLMLGVVGVVVGGGIDASTGAAYNYPETITVSFGENTTVPATPAAEKTQTSQAQVTTETASTK
jgi:hypothetical protein